MICRKFSEHPNSVGETYWEHLIFAWKRGFCLLRLSLACFLHGLFPFLFETTVSDKLEEINTEMKERKNCDDR